MNPTTASMPINVNNVSATTYLYNLTVRNEDDGTIPPDAGNSNTNLWVKRRWYVYLRLAADVQIECMPTK